MSTMTSRTRQMLNAPLLPTLLRLATPNVIGLFATTVVIAYDGYILGQLGAAALAGVALVFPLSMLMLQMSAGGIGGAVTAAVARALGAGRRDDADRLAQHGLLIAALLAGLFTLVMLCWGRGIFSAMGGRDAALDNAMVYSKLLFGGAILAWLANVLAAIVRGSGNMVLPAMLMLGAALAHLPLCPLLVFGWGPLQGLGVAGAAISSLITNALIAALMALYLLRADSAVQLHRERWQLRAELLRSILRVGAPASMNSMLSNGWIAISTAKIGAYGTSALAGYGVAVRLESILVPIAFGFGTAMTALVATNMGAGQTARALRAAWIGGAMVAAITGLIGITVAIAPELWMTRFSTDAAVIAFGSDYLQIAGGCYTLLGLGLALFFASQGAGRMMWPMAASVSRLLVVAVGGWVCLHLLQASATAFFLVIAAGITVYGSMIAGAIALGTWTR